MKSTPTEFLKFGIWRSSANEQVRALVRQRFALPAESTVMVIETACTNPGCPPLETVIAFWVEGQRHHLKIFKPVTAVALDDLPPRWLMRALAVSDEFEDYCC